MGLGQPLDEICAIRASAKTAWTGSITDNGQVLIDAPELFGGDKGEGGLSGTLDVMFGEETQTPVAKLVSMLGGIVPGFRGIVITSYSIHYTKLYDHRFILGMGGQLEPLHLTLGHIGDRQLQRIDDAHRARCVAIEILTDRRFQHPHVDHPVGAGHAVV